MNRIHVRIHQAIVEKRAIEEHARRLDAEVKRTAALARGASLAAFALAALIATSLFGGCAVAEPDATATLTCWRDGEIGELHVVIYGEVALAKAASGPYRSESGLLCHLDIETQRTEPLPPR